MIADLLGNPEWPVGTTALIAALTVLVGAMTAYFYAKVREINRRLEEFQTLVDESKKRKHGDCVE